MNREQYNSIPGPEYHFKSALKFNTSKEMKKGQPQALTSMHPEFRQKGNFAVRVPLDDGDEFYAKGRNWVAETGALDDRVFLAERNDRFPATKCHDKPLRTDPVDVYFKRIPDEPELFQTSESKVTDEPVEPENNDDPIKVVHVHIPVERFQTPGSNVLYETHEAAMEAWRTDECNARVQALAFVLMKDGDDGLEGLTEFDAIEAARLIYSRRAELNDVFGKPI